MIKDDQRTLKEVLVAKGLRFNQLSTRKIHLASGVGIVARRRSTAWAAPNGQTNPLVEVC